jgi:hypothetical protein
MPGNRSEDCRQFAAECLTLARQTADLSIRASLLDMAQKWLELASERHRSHAFRDFFASFNEQQFQHRPKH